MPRRRSGLALTLSGREEISRGIATAQSARSMAPVAGSLAFNGKPRTAAMAAMIDTETALAVKRPGPKAVVRSDCKLANNPRLHA